MEETIYKIEKYNSKIAYAYLNNEIYKLKDYSIHQSKYIKKLLSEQRGGIKLGELAKKIDGVTNMIAPIREHKNLKVEDDKKALVEEKKLLLDEKNKIQNENEELRAKLDNKDKKLKGTTEYILDSLLHS